MSQNRQIIEQLLSGVGDLQQLRSLEPLEQLVREMPKGEDKQLAKRLLVGAYFACFNYNPKELERVLDLDILAEHQAEMLERAWPLATLYCNLSLLSKIIRLGYNPGWTKDQVRQWIIEKGIWWIPFSYDTAKCIYFLKKQDVQKVEEWVSQYFEMGQFWSEVLARLPAQELPAERRQIMELLATGQEPAVYVPEIDVHQSFTNYCNDQGIHILRLMQVGVDAIKYCSYVYLCLDTDGIIKVFKQLLNYKKGPLAEQFNNEDEIYEHLPKADFIPRYYGKVEVSEGLEFMKLSFVYGQSMVDYCSGEQPVSHEEANVLIQDLAKKLEWLHDQGVLYLDLKPENLKVQYGKVQLLDFGVSRIIESPDQKINVFMADSRFAAPEVVQTLKASAKSDMFQLQILYQQLVTGHHPFAVYPGNPYEEGTLAARLQYAWPNSVLANNDGLQLDEIKSDQTVYSRVRQDKRVQEKNTILFPARMGIPHYGHIEFITRLLELGYYVKISLQHAYTITDRDPIPKWLVMKMVAKSLENKGFTSNDFSFLITPMMAVAQQVEMHFSMMPGRENIVGIASGNPAVWDLFRGFRDTLIFPQKTVFGLQDEAYEERSWGEILRSSVRNDDYLTFEQYTASGVQEIVPFSELQVMCRVDFTVEFVEGRVKTALLDQVGDEIISSRVFRYEQPEQSLARKLGAQIIDQYAVHSVWQIDDYRFGMRYVRTEYDGKNMVIYYQKI